jgi:hypothetical protein
MGRASRSARRWQRCCAFDRSTPLILRYGTGDWNALHRDPHGDVFFPFQVVTVLSEPGIDYEGGEPTSSRRREERS